MAELTTILVKVGLLMHSIVATNFQFLTLINRLPYNIINSNNNDL